MRVLHVVTDDARRGAPVFAVQLAAALEAGDTTNRVVALFATPTAGDRLDIPALGPSALHPSTLRRLRGLMTTADVVVAHGSRTLPACGIAGAGTTPFVYRNIGDPLYWANTPARRLRVRALLGRAAAVAALWPGSRDVLIARFGLAPDAVRVIPNGVDTGPLLRPGPPKAGARTAIGLAPERPTIGIVSSLTPEKDLHTALASVPEGWQVAIAGDGPLRAELERTAATRLPGRVAWLGMTDGPRAAFDAADVALLTSLSEGLPAAAIEAGVMGLPVVATDVGGLPSIVIDGVSGRLVRPGDVDGIRAALVDAHHHAGPWGDAAAAHCAAHFAMPVVATRWRALLDVTSVLSR